MLLTYTHVVKDGKSNISLAEVDQPCDPLLTYLPSNDKSYLSLAEVDEHCDFTEAFYYFIQ